jgi:hypothetical protein
MPLQENSSFFFSSRRSVLSTTRDPVAPSSAWRRPGGARVSSGAPHRPCSGPLRRRHGPLRLHSYLASRAPVLSISQSIRRGDGPVELGFDRGAPWLTHPSLASSGSRALVLQDWVVVPPPPLSGALLVAALDPASERSRLRRAPPCTASASAWRAPPSMAVAPSRPAWNTSERTKKSNISI